MLRSLYAYGRKAIWQSSSPEGVKPGLFFNVLGGRRGGKWTSRRA